jgi:hypothetical protein
MNKKALFVGCSHTADSGFTEQNLPRHHWPWLFCQRFDFLFQNSAVGGCSNEEIFYRTIEATNNHKFDLVVVMWSAVGRKWVYFEKENVDDFTIINNGIAIGHNCHHRDLHDYAKIHYSNFNNEYIAVKHWLLQTLSLAAWLKQREIKFIFIKGFENYIYDIVASEYHGSGFKMPSSMKKLLNFDQNPDYYIYEKLTVLKDLVHSNNQDYWFNFAGPAFLSSYYDLDRSDDGAHLGAESNYKLYTELSKFYENIHP